MTEFQALKALEDETKELGEKIKLEIGARKAYVKEAAKYSNINIAMLRLLRRIVVLGVTATDEQKAEVERLLQKWKTAKAIVEKVEQKIKNLIAELKNMESQTAKDAATKAKTNVKAVVAVVKTRCEKQKTRHK